MAEGIYERVRRYRRVPLATPVATLVGTQFLFETSVEISEGGLLMTATRSYDLGARLELRFFLPGSDSVTVTAEVLYQVDAQLNRPRCVGLRFIEPTAAVQNLIRSYVTRL